MNLGIKIKELRKARGITQEQLAKSVNVSFQAVSKWENNICLPDVTVIPALARYFGVSMDELFDFDLTEIKEKAIAIAKESWKYRDSDWEKARNIIDEGLKEYPDNDILLLNRLYVMDYEESPDEVIRVASKIVDITRDDATKHDACRFMAYAYKAKNDFESAKKAIELIPEIYFSNLRLKAEILKGEEKWDAVCKEYSESLYALMYITCKMAECYEERKNYKEAIRLYESSLSVLDILKVKEDWYGFCDGFKEQIASIKKKMK